MYPTATPFPAGGTHVAVQNRPSICALVDPVEVCPSEHVVIGPGVVGLRLHVDSRRPATTMPTACIRSATFLEPII
jgi:hypothetical protein